MDDRNDYNSLVEKPEQLFDFVVGRPWKEHGSLNIYCYGKEVQFGCIEDAKVFKKYVDEKTGEDNNIYKLVKVSLEA